LQRAKLYKWLAAATVVGFLAGISHLMMLRFERGDVYPAYSSYRSDPIGARAFYESLESLEGIRVTRNLRPLSALGPGNDSTLFFVGAGVCSVNTIELQTAQALDAFMSSGGRVVVAMRAAADHSQDGCERPDRDSPQSGSASKPEAPARDSEHLSGNGESGGLPVSTDRSESSPESSSGGAARSKSVYTDLREQWGIVVESGPGSADDAGDGSIGYAASQSGQLPGGLTWHSTAYFSDMSDAWKPLYTANSKCVMAERPVGRGSLVMATDAYFMSNEALKSERHTDLLLYLIAGSRVVIIDETRHGIQRRPGVIGYLRQHRLHWILIALLCVAALFVWRNSVPLVPVNRSRTDYSTGAAEARNAAQGMTNLLRRSIPPQRLLEICFDQWETAFENDHRYPQARREKARHVIERAEKSEGQPDPVSRYRAIRRILLEDQPNE
jgi:hypothetical protein